MSRYTNIQWAHSTNNPVMGCDGCELYPTTANLRSKFLEFLSEHNEVPLETRVALDVTIESGPQAVYSSREVICQTISSSALPDAPTEEVTRLAVSMQAFIEKLYVCYAFKIHRYVNANGKNSGFAFPFEKPKLFPGRMAKAARMRAPSLVESEEKPWIAGFRRLVFVSDMGDALSRRVPFEFLKAEIVDNVTSPAGQRHIWQWLTKRPKRMAEFARWLAVQGIPWPENLVAMTSVTGPKTVFRVRQLLDVPAIHRGLSVEPLRAKVSFPMDGISWLIVGGESGANAHPFDLEWAESLLADSRRASVPFFMKQLGRRPVNAGEPLLLKDAHGGNWDEWPFDHLKVREFPSSWRTPTSAVDSIQPSQRSTAGCTNA